MVTINDSFMINIESYQRKAIINHVTQFFLCNQSTRVVAWYIQNVLLSYQAWKFLFIFAWLVFNVIISLIFVRAWHVQIHFEVSLNEQKALDCMKIHFNMLEFEFCSKQRVPNHISSCTLIRMNKSSIYIINLSFRNSKRVSFSNLRFSI